MSDNFNSTFQESNTYQGKIVEIQSNQNLPTNIPGSLSNTKKLQLEEFKRKIAHQNRISSQENKLEEQLNSDFASLLPIQVSFNSGQSTKRMSLSDIEDSFDNKPKLTPKKRLQKLSKTNKNTFAKRVRLNKKNTVLAFGIATMVIISGITLNNISNTNINSSDKLANAAEVVIKSDLQKKMDAYSSWIKDQNNGQFVDSNTDSDKDGLTNYEEFVIGSKAFTAFSCNENINDSENLINLINPSTCRGIDPDNAEDVKTFGDIINLPLLQTQIGTKKAVIESSNSSTPSSTLEDESSSATNEISIETESVINSN
jgi:hypothetical protein